VDQSKWFDLVKAVVQGHPVECRGGGKEVHATDVAGAVEILLSADAIAGEAYNCCDRYVSRFEVATLARDLTGSASRITGEPSRPKHQIVTDKLQTLGMRFGGRPLLEQTIRQLIDNLPQG
jgi:nucleoside-diphosphate-sugar epimerase